jgi:tetratricopeptide (TPR) repeat protein
MTTPLSVNDVDEADNSTKHHTPILWQIALNDEEIQRMKRRRRPKKQSPPARGSNPMISWAHALAAMGDERWDEVIVALQRFIKMTKVPEDLKIAYQNLGACYLALERYDETLAALADAARFAPDDPDMLHSRGVVYACAARFPEAITAFEEFARRWPTQARQQETRKAIRTLRQAQQGKIPPGTYLLEHLQEQVSHNTEMGDFHLVEQKARRMIVADPERPEGHFALGVACLEQDRYQEALEAFLVAHDLDPQYGPTLYNIGHVYLKLDEPAQARSWLEQALEQDSRNIATLHQLGVACERLGQRAEAIRWWRQALQLDPHYHLAQQRLYEVDEGPEPVEPPLPPESNQLRQMTPVVKARMKRPVIHRNGAITLTYDGQVGFVLEDAENRRNATIHAGGPFRAVQIKDGDLLDMIGLIKLTLQMINVENTRNVAALVYYPTGQTFAYQAGFKRGERGCRLRLMVSS